MSKNSLLSRGLHNETMTQQNQRIKRNRPAKIHIESRISLVLKSPHSVTTTKTL